MRKSWILLITPLFVLSSCALFQGGSTSKSFEGKVRYSITYPESSLTEAQKQQLPSNITLYLKGNKVKSEMITSMMTRITVKDIEQQKTTTLLEMMGQKYAIEQSPEDIRKKMEEQDSTEVTVTDDTKDIAGYTCKKAMVKPKEDEAYPIFFTPEIGSSKMNFDSKAYQKVDGLPLEYQMKTNMFSMKLMADKVEETKISDDVFSIPDDYKKVTPEQLQNMMGQ